MLKLQLTRADDYEGVYLRLPATPAEIGEAWAWLDNISADVASTRIVGVISDVWNIGNYLKRADVNDSVQLKKLNRIAELMRGLNRDECLIFQGGLDSESINGLDDVIDVGAHLNRYLLVPHVTTERELGICLVSHGVKPFDESVQPYLDYSRIGIEYYANHGGAFIAGGYVVRRDSAEPELIDAVEGHDRQTPGMQMDGYCTYCVGSSVTEKQGRSYAYEQKRKDPAGAALSPSSRLSRGSGAFLCPAG